MNTIQAKRGAARARDAEGPGSRTKDGDGSGEDGGAV